MSDTILTQADSGGDEAANGAVSKRDFLKAAGATAAVAGLGLRAEAKGDPARWDLIVVGGGNAGLPAAIFAAKRGARVLIVEAAGTVGGTLFLSTGQMAAAGTKLQKSKGIEDSPQIHYDDIMRISKGTADPVVLRLAVDNAAAAFDWLMDNGMAVRPEHPVTGTTHEPYSRPRYAWAPGPARGGIAILQVLNAQMQPEIDAGRIRVLTGTQVTSLIQRKDGTVEGVVARGADGRTSRHLGRYTVLTAGGYTANPTMYRELEGATDYTQATYPFSQGASATLGVAAGGYVRGTEKHTPLFGAVLMDSKLPSPIRTMARHFPGDRPPWEIFVNVAGKRFIQEDALSHDVYEQGLAKQPDERCWAIFDDAIFRKAPPLARGGLAGPWTAEDTIRAFEAGNVPMFYRADTIAELAKKAGVDAPGLEATVAEYNRAQSGAAPDAFGRKYMPLPIAKAPFYALQTQSWNLTSYAGIAVDGQLRVIRKDGTPIAGLYAAGEALGVGTTMGKAVCGGMSVTPALALGRLLGHEILQFGA